MERMKFKKNRKVSLHSSVVRCGSRVINAHWRQRLGRPRNTSRVQQTAPLRTIFEPAEWFNAADAATEDRRNGPHAVTMITTVKMVIKCFTLRRVY